MSNHPFYSIRAMSNLHVGSGEGDFSAVDKQVQRDVLTGLPTIHASSLKGALREAMEHADESHKDNVTKVFGSDPKRKSGKTQQGQYKFFDAHLLALPIRSSQHFYYLATCPMLVQALADTLKTFQPGTETYPQALESLPTDVTTEKPKYLGNNYGTLHLDDWTGEHVSTAIPDEVKELLGERIAILHNDDFAKLASELPIIARNYLENGSSENLWYEEVVPREARFYTQVFTPDAASLLDAFLTARKQIVQIGANATVGYGVCEMKKIG